MTTTDDHKARISRRRPAAVLALVLAVMVPMVTECMVGLRLDSSVGVLSGAALAILAIALRRPWASTGGVCALAVLLAADASTQCVPKRTNTVSAFRARVDGIVTAIVHETAWTTILEVEGCVDASGLPAQRGVLTRLTVRRSGPPSAAWPPVIGSRLVSDAVVRLPEAPIIPTEVDERVWTRSRAIHWLGTTQERRVDVRDRPHGWVRWPQEVRQKLRSWVYASYPSDVAPIVMALLSGQQQDIPPEQRAVFATAGTAHMFSVSGSHVVVVIGMVLVVVGWLPPIPRFVVAALAVGAFIVMTGCELPAVRAGLAGAVVMFARTRERGVDVLNLLGAVVVAMIVNNPMVLWNTGMQLSVAACAGLCIVPPTVNLAVRRWGLHHRYQPLVTAPAASFAASVAVAIPSALSFGTVAMLSPIVNLAVIPMLATAMLTAGGSMLVQSQPHLAEPLLTATTVLVRLGCQASGWSAALEPTIGRPLLVAILQCAGLFWLLRSQRPRHALVRCCCVVVTVMMAAQTHQGVLMPVIGRGPGCDVGIVPDANGKLVLLRTYGPPDAAIRERLQPIMRFLGGVHGNLVVVTRGREASRIVDRVGERRRLLRVDIDERPPP